jgi:phospholipase/carboxylesterase
MSKSELSIRIPKTSGAVEEVISSLHCATVAPVGPLKRVIIGLHGFGDNAQNFSEVASQIRIPGTLWVVPEAPTSVPFSMAQGSQWFPLFSEFHGELERSLQKVQSLIEKIQSASDLDWQNIYVLGFSQGAAVCLNLACQMNVKFGGIIALSGFFAGSHRYRQINETSLQTPLFLGHGLQDNVVLPTMHFESLDALQHFGFTHVYSRTYNCGHTLASAEIQDIVTFVEKGSL